MKQLKIEQCLYGGFFLVIVMVLFLRAPEIILKGRFWAEEATVYYKYAYEHNTLQALLFTYFRCGYYYLSANFTVWLATLFPIEYAPLVTTIISFFITVLILYVIYFTPSFLFPSYILRIVFCLYLVVGPHVIAEVYCNSINTQVYWGIFGVMFLFIDFKNLEYDKSFSFFCPKIIFLDILLLIACFSGLYCVILFPFFIVKYFILGNEKHTGRHIKIMLFPFIIQLGLVLYSKFFAGMASSKLSVAKLEIQGIMTSLRHHLIRPVLGVQATYKLSIALCIIYGSLLLIIFTLSVFLNRKDIKKVFLQFSLLILFSYYFVYVQIGALGSVAGGRYAFISGSIAGLLIMICVENIVCSLKQSSWLMLYILLFIPIFIGCIDYQGNSNFVYLDYSKAPDWRQQVQQYKKEPEEYKFKVWPYHKEWYFSLEQSK